MASGPSEEEFESAVAVVRQYLETRAVAEAERFAAAEATPQQELPRGTPAVAPAPAAMDPPQLSVEGAVEATSFLGDGSALAGVPPPSAVMFFDGPCPTTWTPYLPAQGRYVVGARTEGLNIGTQVGTTIDTGELENRSVGAHDHPMSTSGQHSLTVNDTRYDDRVTPVQPDHATPNGDDAGGLATVEQTTTIGSNQGIHLHAVGFAGTTFGTNAPYVILTPCKKS